MTRDWVAINGNVESLGIATQVRTRTITKTNERQTPRFSLENCHRQSGPFVLLPLFSPYPRCIRNLDKGWPARSSAPLYLGVPSYSILPVNYSSSVELLAGIEYA